MSAFKSSKNTGKKADPKSAHNLVSNDSVEVLYQKMGDRWFAFSLVNEEVFVGSISQEEIDRLEAEPGTAGKKSALNARNTRDS